MFYFCLGGAAAQTETTISDTAKLDQTILTVTKIWYS